MLSWLERDALLSEEMHGKTGCFAQDGKTGCFALGRDADLLGTFSLFRNDGILKAWWTIFALENPLLSEY